MKELQIEATKENLPQVFQFVQEELTECGCTKKTQRQIKLCVEEIYMNIVLYAYNPEIGPATISVEVIKDPMPIRVVISFTDHGRPYDPLSHEDPDRSLSLDDTPVGGLGIFLVKNTVDGLSYRYEEGHNILTIEKELQEEKTA